MMNTRDLSIEAIRSLDKMNIQDLTESILMASHCVTSPDGRKVMSPLFGEQGMAFARQMAEVLVEAWKKPPAGFDSNPELTVRSNWGLEDKEC
jgi:23S rRNA U2552 (ribose-2'-O)-methylase RlmE/FtsJ